MPQRQGYARYGAAVHHMERYITLAKINASAALHHPAHTPVQAIINLHNAADGMMIKIHGAAV